MSATIISSFSLFIGSLKLGFERHPPPLLADFRVGGLEKKLVIEGPQPYGAGPAILFGVFNRVI
jgi:hypothetical protein